MENTVEKLSIPIECSHTKIAEVATLVENPRNPNGHPDSQIELLAKIIANQGWRSPIVVSKRSGFIVKGHGRFQAALKLGVDTVPIDEQDYESEAKEWADLIADNRLSELAEIDRSELKDLLEDLDDGSFDMDLTGFLEEDIADLMSEFMPENEGLTDEDAVPEVPEEPTTKLGQIFKLGDHRIMCGDCRNSKDMAKLIDRKIDVAFTSPPYASQRKYDESSGFKPIHPDEFKDWFKDVQSNIREHLAETGSWFVNIKEHCEDGQRSLYVKDLTIAHVREWKWVFIDEFAWTKSGVPGKWPNRFKNAWEPVFHFSKNSSIKMRHDNVTHASSDLIEYHPDNPKTHSGFISGTAGVRKEGEALPSNVITVFNSPQQTDTKGKKHDATFPVGFPLFFIKAYTDELDLVFDPFLGSGTTLIAAEKCGRICYGSEISPAYCDVIIQRWEEFTGKKAELIEDKKEVEA